ncbi:DUF839 domain-containing protein, partial [Clostridium perfringens]
DEKGVWIMDTTSTHARRINGFSKFDITGPAKGIPALKGATTATGTCANCSGGVTLWTTGLSCEENFEDTAAVSNLPDTQYGWVVEVEPFYNSFLKKHTA